MKNLLNLELERVINSLGKKIMILLKKHVPVEIDMSEWSRDVLEMLICESVEKDISINDVICGIIEKAL